MPGLSRGRRSVWGRPYGSESLEKRRKVGPRRAATQPHPDHPPTLVELATPDDGTS